MRKMLGLGLVPLAACLTLTATSATATPIVWTLHDVTFDDGATASGQFSSDSLSGVLLSYDITTTPGAAFSGEHYDGIGDQYFLNNAIGTYSFTIILDDFSRYLNMSFVNPLTGSGTNPLVLFPSAGSTYECNNCSISRLATGGFATTFDTAVPEPATLFLLGSGAVALRLRRRRSAW